MRGSSRPLVFTLVVFFVWLAMTIGGGALQTGGEMTLEDLVVSGPVYGIIAAAVFALGIVAYKNWWREVGFKGMEDRRAVRYLVLPGLLIATTFAVGLQGVSAMGFVGILFLNTLFVGFSEELALRGILLHGVSTRKPLVRSVVIVAILFGASHALNGFVTGQFGQAAAQAAVATLSGLWLGALRIRLTSIIPVMVLHALWDFGTLAISAAARAGTIPQTFSLAQFSFLAVLIVYGIWLLRGYEPVGTPKPAVGTA